MRIPIQYMRDNARETSRVAVNGAKMLEEATHLTNVTIRATFRLKIELNQLTQ